MTVDVRRARTRFHTATDWLESWHSFSFGPHHDPDNVGHGLLLVSNDDVVAPATGFGTHGHRDMEIVTWVLAGELAHRDSTGTDDVIRPGLAQRMSAGTGIRHSETNPSPDTSVHFVQMWVPPSESGIEPGYEQLDIADHLAAGGLVTVASGRTDDAAITIHQRDATLHVARLAGG
ncbi:MAG: pirin family protein, partial [Acidimicrobiia bacterium]|nr:pirin family protein [Acidimicrobiia bacterium]